MLFQVIPSRTPFLCSKNGELRDIHYFESPISFSRLILTIGTVGKLETAVSGINDIHYDEKEPK